jgi:hypothetical protein
MNEIKNENSKPNDDEREQCLTHSESDSAPPDALADIFKRFKVTIDRIRDDEKEPIHLTVNDSEHYEAMLPYDSRRPTQRQPPLLLQYHGADSLTDSEEQIMMLILKGTTADSEDRNSDHSDPAFTTTATLAHSMTEETKNWFFVAGLLLFLPKFLAPWINNVVQNSHKKWVDRVLREVLDLKTSPVAESSVDALESGSNEHGLSLAAQSLMNNGCQVKLKPKQKHHKSKTRDYCSNCYCPTVYACVKQLHVTDDPAVGSDEKVHPRQLRRPCMSNNIEAENFLRTGYAWSVARLFCGKLDDDVLDRMVYFEDDNKMSTQPPHPQPHVEYLGLKNVKKLITRLTWFRDAFPQNEEYDRFRRSLRLLSVYQKRLYAHGTPPHMKISVTDNERRSIYVRIREVAKALPARGFIENSVIDELEDWKFRYEQQETDMLNLTHPESSDFEHELSQIEAGKRRDHHGKQVTSLSHATLALAWCICCPVICICMVIPSCVAHVRECVRDLGSMCHPGPDTQRNSRLYRQATGPAEVCVFFAQLIGTLFMGCLFIFLVRSEPCNDILIVPSDSVNVTIVESSNVHEISFGAYFGDSNRLDSLRGLSAVSLFGPLVWLLAFVAWNCFHGHTAFRSTYFSTQLSIAHHKVFHFGLLLVHDILGLACASVATATALSSSSEHTLYAGTNVSGRCVFWYYEDRSECHLHCASMTPQEPVGLGSCFALATAYCVLLRIVFVVNSYCNNYGSCCYNGPGLIFGVVTVMGTSMFPLAFALLIQ